MIIGGFEEFKMCHRKNPKKVVEALQEVVCKAMYEGRVATGIAEMTSILKRFQHKGVMFCIVEIKSENDIQIKLLEAFCREHNIKLIKVDHCHKLFYSEQYCETATTDTRHTEAFHGQTDAVHGQSEVCTCRRTTDNLKDRMGEPTVNEEPEVTCLLLTQPSHLTCEEQFVLTYYDTYRSFNHDEYPILRLPEPVLSRMN